MDKWQRRTVYYLLTLVVVIAAYAVAYHEAMAAFEGRSQSFLHSLQVVVETFTTTGFGSDAPWSSPEMNVLVIAMDLTGVLLIFMTLPVFVFPLFEETLSTNPPTAVDDSLADHAVICTYTVRGETLVDELDARDVPYVLVEPDRETALDLHESGYEVVYADPESIEGLEAASVSTASAVVADVSDQVDASIVLAAHEAAPDVHVVSVVEDPTFERYHRLAGADTVLSPRQLVARSLANKVTTAVEVDLGDTVGVGTDFEVAEFPVHRGSSLVGTTLAESGIRERSGANVIGAWVNGEFESPLSPDAEIDGSTVLLVTGREAQLDQLREMTLSQSRRHERGPVVIVGYGKVGRTVADALDTADVPYTVVDREAMEGVDVVGDATDPETLRRADVESARTVIMAMPDDTTTVFVTLVVRDLDPTVEVVARAEETDNVSKIYRAGADYVLALATVSGRMLASTVIEGEEVVSFDKSVEVVRTRQPALAGQTLEEANVRSRTGCTVVAVERNGDVVTEFGPEFRFRADDDVVVAGTDEDVARFSNL